MSWKQLVAAQRVKTHTTSSNELDALRTVIARDLADASLPDLSADRRFATAYNAVLQVAKMVIACAGYRVTGIGHHQTTFEAIELAMGSGIAKLSAYFDTCRRKRNLVDYDMANVASDMEVEELLKEAEHFFSNLSRHGSLPIILNLRRPGRNIILTTRENLTLTLSL
jgi:hypothetical protein